MLRMNDFQIMQDCKRCESHDPDRHMQLILWAEELFESTLGRGRWSRLWGFLVGVERSLAHLDRGNTILRSSYEAGRRTVPIKQIRGTEGRETDFDASFYPLNKRSRSRWVSIAAAKYTGAEMPPVRLVQVGEQYFVRDGHHRISVGSAFGEEAIDADVIVWELEEKPASDVPLLGCKAGCNPT